MNFDCHMSSLYFNVVRQWSQYVVGTCPGELYKTTVSKMVVLAFLERDLEYIPLQIGVMV